MPIQIRRGCRACYGSGKARPWGVCYRCNGTGREPEDPDDPIPPEDAFLIAELQKRGYIVVKK